ncbi:TPM domain-containing protein [Flavobacterium rhizosphaerae]|uniref:TPM domain-containing protein n=1 Tax=Flavobacterium rhizosphaerae TaxID=3163298 RepID=A0ABW8YY00_9FLAO
MKKIFILSVVFIMALLLPYKGLAQFEIPKKPIRQKSVYDFAHVLSTAQDQKLRQKLENYSDTTSTQIVIATVYDLKGESAARVAPEWAQTWGIGQAKEDNGIFILVDVGGHDMYIATGYGVQGRLPAGTVGTIIREYITLEFKKGDYYAGLDAGTTAIFQALDGKFKAKSQHKGNRFPVFPIIMIIVIIVFIVMRGGRGGGRGGRRGGLDLADILILSSLGSGRHSSGGWGGGSSGGGGFGGGFGGGGFSGGGAGGSW